MQRARLAQVLLLLSVMLAHAAAAPAAVPAQFIAKMYTEVLGRAPDPEGWQAALNYFEVNGCDQTRLADWGGSVFESAEFRSLGYDAAAITLILYRSILNREPDPAGYRVSLSALDSGEALPTVAAEFFAAFEFARLVPYICSGASYSFGTLGTGLAIAITASKAGGYGNLTETDLQALLDSTQAGGSVYLQQESVVFLTQPLEIPAGVTLATYGLPPPREHALMARLIRAAPFPGPMVQINFHDNPVPSGSLRSIWVDGQRARATPFVAGAINIEIYGGAEVTLDSNFLSNSLGWSTVHSYGSLDGRVCSGNTITNNVITAYSSVHASQQWTDGLSLGCEHSVVANNQVVDPSDVGIVVFNAWPATQQSAVTHNTVLSSGNSAFGAYAFDPLQGRSAGTPDFTGATISNNVLWSGPNSHFIIGLAVGSRPWFKAGDIGRGAAAIGNSTAGVRTRLGAGVVVSGMDSATVQANVLDDVPIPASWTSCSIGGVLASISAGLASGSIQSHEDVEVNGCMSDYSSAASSAAGTEPHRSGAPSLGLRRGGQILRK